LAWTLAFTSPIHSRTVRKKKNDFGKGIYVLYILCPQRLSLAPGKDAKSNYQLLSLGELSMEIQG